MKVVILDAKTLTNDDIDFSVFDEFGEVTIYDYTKYNQIAERIKDAEIILCNKSIMNRMTLKDAKNVKYIGLFATGYNNVDIEYTNERNITVCNAGSYSTNAVAQHVFALILEHYNKVGEYNKFVKDGGWIHSEKFSPFKPMKEMDGRTLGIVGYGSIGKKVAKIAQAFDMKVLAYNRSPKKDESVRFVEMDELLEKSDIVSIHCPLNSDSEKMCNKEFFEKMKDGALFINTSRGGVVDEQALIDAVKSKKISGAGLDVVAVEPMEKHEEILDIDNIIITPHSAWAPVETRTRLVEIVKNNIKKWVAGAPVNVIK
ncbi:MULTISPECIES: D-2-hydroxyacid dehydrogenase [Eubacterium]|uniref:D-2-hydroxyacid dehydrogenase n=1 Tax=Eubacterium album TaxID=2978477 RepID=A0ABT2LWH3_9FIRM|nr:MULTISPECIES: D-2-hydroxyacid dehydrogenase [unclassified Eubacterium (in: firmicutes)]MCT7397648.1 D-2-hydroxyacid dehydrogenase [Eubacterium sp. LFL-14]RGG62159.1 D-2-hydroxyacid dehydrogenase [Eubacterium sp. AF17-7]RHR34195.1 D-2-hydroxyacid dehydrogenase [Eubacterium sp. AF19-12LB]